MYFASFCSLIKGVKILLGSVWLVELNSLGRSGVLYISLS